MEHSSSAYYDIGIVLFFCPYTLNYKVLSNLFTSLKYNTMAQHNNATSNHRNASLTKRIVLGASIGLLLICLFLITAGSPDPAWPKLWFLRPLIIVPFAGALGGLCTYFLVKFHNMLGLNKTVAVILSILIFIVGLWMGSIVGLVGTYWN
jgi:hypothetical protein